MRFLILFLFLFSFAHAEPRVPLIDPNGSVYWYSCDSVVTDSGSCGDSYAHAPYPGPTGASIEMNTIDLGGGTCYHQSFSGCSIGTYNSPAVDCAPSYTEDPETRECLFDGDGDGVPDEPLPCINDPECEDYDPTHPDSDYDGDGTPNSEDDDDDDDGIPDSEDAAPFNNGSSSGSATSGDDEAEEPYECDGYPVFNGLPVQTGWNHFPYDNLTCSPSNINSQLFNGSAFYVSITNSLLCDDCVGYVKMCRAGSVYSIESRACRSTDSDSSDSTDPSDPEQPDYGEQLENNDSVNSYSGTLAALNDYGVSTSRNQLDMIEQLEIQTTQLDNLDTRLSSLRIDAADIKNTNRDLKSINQLILDEIQGGALTGGLSSADSVSLSSIDSGVSLSNSYLSGISGSSSDIADNTQGILDALTGENPFDDTYTDGSEDFETLGGEVETAFSTFWLVDPLGINSMASYAVPTYSFSLMGQTFILFGPELFANIPMDLIRNIFLFVAAMGGIFAFFKTT